MLFPTLTLVASLVLALPVDDEVELGGGRLLRGTIVKETAEPTADPANGRRRLVGTLQDVTDRRAAERALQRANELLERRLEERTAELRVAKNAARAAETAAHESQDRFLAAAEALMDGLAIYDAEDRLVFHNGRYPEHAPPSFRAAMKLGARFEDMVRTATADGGIDVANRRPDGLLDVVLEQRKRASLGVERQEALPVDVALGHLVERQVDQEPDLPLEVLEVELEGLVWVLVGDVDRGGEVEAHA